jgi:hypothetical protein
MFFEPHLGHVLAALHLGQHVDDARDRRLEALGLVLENAKNERHHSSQEAKAGKLQQLAELLSAVRHDDAVVMLAVEVQQAHSGLLLHKGLRGGGCKDALDLRGKLLGRLTAANVGNEGKRQTVGDLAARVQVCAERVNDERHIVAVLVKEQPHSHVTLRAAIEWLQMESE